MANKLSVGKLICIGAVAFGTIGAAVIDAQRDIAEELPKLANNSKDVIDAVAKNVEES